MAEVAPIHSEPAPHLAHVAIIMDGNGRWARARGLPRTAGHKRGAESVKTVVECAARMGVRYLTLFGFSSENWKRPQTEISDLMGLLRYYLQHEVAYLHKHEIRLRFIGNRNQLPVDIVKLIDSAEFQTRNNHALTLTIALSYGGRAEIVEATRRVAEKVAMRTVSPSDIDEEMLAENLYTADIPDPDLLIRTSGEKRISNFLLWQLAYAELIFVDTLWPDFSQEDFAEALSEFQRRERRYGAAGA